MATAKKNTKSASGARGKASSGAKKGGARPPSTEERIARTLWGVLLFGIGILMLASLIMEPSAPLIRFVRDVQQGAAGTLCFVLPFLLGWGGILMTFTRRNPDNPKRVLAVLALLLLVATGAQIFELREISRIAGMGKNPETYDQFLKVSIDQSTKYATGGGFIGALLAWPLHGLLGVWGSMLLLGAVVLADLVFLTGVSLNEVGGTLSEKWSDMRDNMDERKEERYQRRMEMEEVREQERQQAQQINARPDPRMAASDFEDPGFAHEAPLDVWAEVEPPKKPRKRSRSERLYMETIGEEAAPREQFPRTLAPQNTLPPNSSQRAEPFEKTETLPPLVDFSSRAQRKRPISSASRPEPQPEVAPPIKGARFEPLMEPRIAHGGHSLYIETIDIDASGGYDTYENGADDGRVDDCAAYDAPSYEEPALEENPFGAYPARPAPPVAERDHSIPWEEEPWGEAEADPAPWDQAPWDEPIAPTQKPVRTAHASRDTIPPASAEPAAMAERRLDQTPIALPKKKESAPPPPPPYRYPPMSLLNPPKRQANIDTRKIDEANAAKLLATLQSFGVQAKVLNVTHGPAITRYELQPAPGVKVSRIVNLVDDIALNMAAAGVRIEAPIPGKPAIGIEIPNESIATVVLREVLESDDVQEQASALACALGKDIAGRRIVADLARMPHVLIAGATGSGKSVCINTLIMSLVFRSSPEEVRMILIDPKVVELSVYNGIPHLLVPVVTDPKKASGALSWAVSEMESRYRNFAERGVRDIRGFNAALLADEPMMPQIVVIIDELADLMMVAPGEVEESICRLAQLARAAGIHLVIATQRPSVNVITGVIKANIPSRIAFAVSSQVDSRTILDSAGAEKLLGKGDMLYAPQGAGKPVRVQGCFVSDEEVSKVVKYVSDNRPAEYDEDVIEHLNNTTESAQEAAAETEEVLDDLLPQAIEIALELGQASISMLQRRLRVGYARAGRLIDEMARRGIISQAEGAKPREVLMSREEYRRLFEME